MCLGVNKCMETAVINYRCGNVVRGNAATVTTGEASESGGRGQGGGAESPHIPSTTSICIT